MTKEQLKEWYRDKFNSCYFVKHDNYPNSIYMYYDINYIRSKKLANILNKDVEYPTEINGICLFQQDLKNSYLLCNYDEIWSFFKENYSSNSQEISQLIKGWMEEYDKLKVLTPYPHGLKIKTQLEEHNKTKVLTPYNVSIIETSKLEEHNKIKLLTPICGFDLL